MLRVIVNLKVRVFLKVLGLALCLLPVSASAEATRYFILEGFGQLLDGNPETTAINELGEMTLAPKMDLALDDPETIPQAATRWRGKVYISDVDTTEVRRLDGDTLKTFFKIEQSMVTAMAGTKKHLLVAGSPAAAIHRVDSKAKLVSSVAVDSAYVWDMATKGDTIYAVTGDPGQVLKIAGDKVEVLFESEEDHLRTIEVEGDTLWVGGGSSGILYRSENGKNFRALFDSGHTEITAIVPDENRVFVAAVTGADGVLSGVDSAREAKVRSQVFVVYPDGSSEALAGSNDEAVFALAKGADGQILVATGATGREDPRGRLYGIDPDRRVVSMLYQSTARRFLHALRDGSDIDYITAEPTQVLRSGAAFLSKGEFVSAVFDAGLSGKVGMVEVLGEFPKGTKAEVTMRSGYTEDPDTTWSSWCKDVDAPGREAIKVEQGRYFQVKVILSGKKDLSPKVNALRVSYRRQNMAPFVKSVALMPRGVSLRPVVQERAKPKTIDLSGEKKADPKKKSAASRARTVFVPNALTVRWAAEDSNDDKLKYRLLMRRPGDKEWTMLKENLEDSFASFDALQFPSGRVQFRVEASDAASNPKGEARTDRRESPWLLIDNHPPKLSKLSAKGSSGRLVVKGRIEEELGVISEASYSVDGGEPQILMVEDGILDGPKESFEFEVEGLTAGEHSVTLRVKDEMGNESTEFVNARTK